MKTLRPGDLVTLTARVTRVAPHDLDGQQIEVKLLPNGEELGWLLQKEVAFEPKQLTLKVGDIVRKHSMIGEDNRWEIMALFDDNQVAVKKCGCWPINVITMSDVERIG